MATETSTGRTLLIPNLAPARAGDGLVTIPSVDEGVEGRETAIPKALGDQIRAVLTGTTEAPTEGRDPLSTVRMEHSKPDLGTAIYPALVAIAASSSSKVPPDIRAYLTKVSGLGGDREEKAVASVLYRLSLHAWRRLRLVVVREDGATAWEGTANPLFPDGGTILVAHHGAYSLIHAGLIGPGPWLDDRDWALLYKPPLKAALGVIGGKVPFEEALVPVRGEETGATWYPIE